MIVLPSHEPCASLLVCVATHACWEMHQLHGSSAARHVVQLKRTSGMNVEHQLGCVSLQPAPVTTEKGRPVTTS